ncbi:anti-sigma factor [Streptomyces longispororuber]|uniref:anti-sigma factor n=1 Tax=Streptomyces longispororuber TaxID=68230 RepID=UPI00210CA837|nr:anti-sigma factor [Streptomyces longispororuber]MCQ4210653.1 anti-sigma factor [Streptomyces longispororuber]
MTAVDLHTLTGAYALHALGPAEQAEFERHLAACEACAQEVRELSATAARLGLALTVVPPDGFKESVLRRIDSVRQAPPSTSSDAAGAGAPRRARRVQRWVLAACVAAVAGLGATTVWQYVEARDARQEARRAQEATDQVADVLAAPDAKARTARLAGGASGTVVVSESRDRAVFVAASMAEPPSGKVYQLWFDEDGTMRPAGLMDPHRTAQTVLLEGAVGDASGMGITVEPAGGSAHPTSAPVALMRLPA